MTPKPEGFLLINSVILFECLLCSSHCARLKKILFMVFALEDLTD